MVTSYNRFESELSGLSPERVRMLDALGFEWALWDPKKGPRTPRR